MGENVQLRPKSFNMTPLVSRRVKDGLTPPDSGLGSGHMWLAVRDWWSCSWPLVLEPSLKEKHPWPSTVASCPSGRTEKPTLKNWNLFRKKTVKLSPRGIWYSHRWPIPFKFSPKFILPRKKRRFWCEETFCNDFDHSRNSKLFLWIFQHLIIILKLGAKPDDTLYAK